MVYVEPYNRGFFPSERVPSGKEPVRKNPFIATLVAFQGSGDAVHVVASGTEGFTFPFL